LVSASDSQELVRAQRTSSRELPECLIEEEGADTTETGVESLTWKSEADEQLRFSFPIMVSYICQTCIPLVTFLFVGRLDHHALAAAGLATMSANVAGWSVLVGLTSALRTFCSQAYGAGNYHMVGVFVQRGVVVTSTASLPLALLFFFGGNILHEIGLPHSTTLLAASNSQR